MAPVIDAIKLRYLFLMSGMDLDLISTTFTDTLYTITPNVTKIMIIS